jgi:hypothetical protein
MTNHPAGILHSIYSKALTMFYIVPVNVSYDSLEDVPDYIQVWVD